MLPANSSSSPSFDPSTFNPDFTKRVCVKECPTMANYSSSTAVATATPAVVWYNSATNAEEKH